MSSEIGNTSPQFETVEYAAETGNCALCNQPVGSTHYKINGHPVCAKCADRERTAQQDSTANYSRALAFGIVAAIIGMAVYATFEIVTGWIIGYVALAVGWFVGKAMLFGSKGMGGRKYQITAAVLTYAAVSLAALPLMFYHLNKEKKEHSQVQVRQQAPAEQGNSSQADATSSADVAPEAQGNGGPGESVEPKMGFGKAVGMLLLIGLASPFLELASPVHGVIGLVILFIGIQIAWKIMARPKLVIEGPF
jgi:hypothetical protein